MRETNGTGKRKGHFLRTLSTILSFLLVSSACVFVLSGMQRVAVAGELHPSRPEVNAPHPVVAEGFSVLQRSYDYGENRLIVLEVENQSDADFDVTVAASFLDDSGATVQQDVRSFDGFAAGWRNCFFFRAEAPFTEFTYQLTAEPAEYPAVASELTLTWRLSRGYAISPEEERRLELEMRSSGQDGLQTVPAIFLDLLYRNRASYAIGFAGEYLVVDPDGEVFAVNSFACEAEAGAQDGVQQSAIYYWEDGDAGAATESAYPEELRGNVTVYVSLTAASDDSDHEPADAPPYIKRNFAIPGLASRTFSVSGKRYTDADGAGDVVVLDVRNVSSEAQSLTIRAQYLSRSGIPLKEETRTFDGFAAGWSNSFLFEPGIEFYSFAYTVESAPYGGSCLAELVDVDWTLSSAVGFPPDVAEHLADYWASGELPAEQKMVCLELTRRSGASLDMLLRGDLLLVGADGRILGRLPESSLLLPAGESVCTATTLCPFDDGGRLPAEVDGGRMRVVYAIRDVSAVADPQTI